VTNRVEKGYSHSWWAVGFPVVGALVWSPVNYDISTG
jgi:hypothetical protein